MTPLMLEGKTVLVTGATSGIGMAVLETCLREKVSAVLALGRDTAKLDDLLQRYPSAKGWGRIIPIAADFHDPAGLDIAMERVGDFQGAIDGVVLSAGIDKTLPFGITTEKTITEVLHLNTMVPLELIRRLLKAGRLKGSASIILVSSVMGLVGQPGKAAYCASKSALIGAAKVLALELAPQRIRVNVVAPGVVETPLTENLFRKMTAENLLKLKEMHPLGFGKPDDVAELILFLLSGRSSWITGTTITIDGGYTAH